jgi:hypothetical protein
MKDTININEVYKAAEKIAMMPRKARRLHCGKLLAKYPGLNTYDLDDIIGLYLNAFGRV